MRLPFGMMAFKSDHAAIVCTCRRATRIEQAVGLTNAIGTHFDDPWMRVGIAHGSIGDVAVGTRAIEGIEAGTMRM
jgi:hypothetical protein